MFLGPKHDLGEAFAIAQINEDDAAVVPAGIHPTGESHGPANVFLAQAVAGGVAIHKGAGRIGDDLRISSAEEPWAALYRRGRGAARSRNQKTEVAF